MFIDCYKCVSMATHRHCGDSDHHHLCGGSCDEELPCISEDCDDNNWLICQKCKSYHVASNNCVNKGNLQLCRSIGHNGFIINSTKDERRNYCKYRLPEYILKRSNFSDIDFVFGANAEEYEILNQDQTKMFQKDYSDIDDYPYYYRGDYNIYFLDATKIIPKGPDGGMSK